MSVSAKDMGPVLFEAEDDDLPDFSGDEWAMRIDGAPITWPSHGKSNAESSKSN